MENKRSLRCLIVAACLALLIVSIGGVVSAAGTAVETNDDLKISGAQLDISDKISIAYVVDASAIGYNAEKNTASTKVYTYTENPTGSATAAGEKEVKTLKLMTVGGKDYVMFVSEGFAPVAYGETVYVRLENREENNYGKVYKTSVIEVVKNLQAKLDAADERYEAKAGLYNAILTYGKTAQKVLGSEYPVYNYFTVADGGYADSTGATWTSGVVEKGTEVELIPDVNTGMPAVWTDGTDSYETNTIAVADGANYTLYYDMSIVNEQPWVTGWNGLASGSYSETQIKQYLIDKGLDKVSTTSATGISTRTFSVNEQGNGVWSISQPNRYYKDSASIVSSTSIGSGNHFFRFRTDYAQADQPMVMSFTLNFPANDINGSGVAYDYGPYQYQVYDIPVYLTADGEETTDATAAATDTNGNPVPAPDDEGNPKYNPSTYYANGDMFKTTGNDTMLRFPIYAVDAATSGTTSIFMYLGFNAVKETNADGVSVVTGFKLRMASGTTSSGKTDGDSNNYSNGTVFDINTPHDISLEFVPADDGTVDEIKVYVDGDYILSHTAAKGTAQGGFTANTAIFGSSKTAKFIGFDGATLGRFVGDYEISNVRLTMQNHVTVDTLEANGYSSTMTGLTTGAIVAGYDVANQKTVHYAWNQLNDGEKNVLLSNDLTNAYWQYNAATDSVLVNKLQTSIAGTANFLIANPLYNATDYNGKTAVFEFTMSMGNQDRDGDSKYDTNTDNRGESGSTVWGQLNIGYGDGQYDYSRAYVANGAVNRTINGISDNDSLLGNFRIRKSNTTGVLNMWGLIYYNQIGDIGNGCNDVYSGSRITVRIAVTIGEDGVPTMLKYYANNVLITTRYNGLVAEEAKDTNDYAGFTWCSDTTGAKTSFVDAPYFEISQFMRDDGYCMASFSNFRSWIQ